MSGLDPVRTAQVLELLDRIGSSGPAVPASSLQMWARQAADIARHGRVLTVAERDQLLREAARR